MEHLSSDESENTNDFWCFERILRINDYVLETCNIKYLLDYTRCRKEFRSISCFCLNNILYQKLILINLWTFYMVKCSKHTHTLHTTQLKARLLKNTAQSIKNKLLLHKGRNNFYIDSKGTFVHTQTAHSTPWSRITVPHLHFFRNF